MELTIYGYRGWDSIRAIGSTTLRDAEIVCNEIIRTSDYEAVRAINEVTCQCVVSIERDSDGQIVDRSSVTV